MDLFEKIQKSKHCSYLHLDHIKTVCDCFAVVYLQVQHVVDKDVWNLFVYNKNDVCIYALQFPEPLKLNKKNLKLVVEAVDAIINDLVPHENEKLIRKEEKQIMEEMENEKKFHDVIRKSFLHIK
jgi:hypothetical protein